MSESLSALDPQLQPIYAEREIVLDDIRHLVDLCHITRGVVEASRQDVSNSTESTVMLSGIPHRNGLLPPNLRQDLQGIGFSRLSLTVQRLALVPKPLVTVIGQDLDRPTHHLSITESSYPVPDMFVTDNEVELMERRKKSVKERVDRSEVALWLASQALGSSHKAMGFLTANGDSALSKAAALLEVKARRKHTVDGALINFLNYDILQTQLITSRDAQDPFSEPDSRHYTASISRIHAGSYLPSAIEWLKEDIVVSFCPESGVVDPVKKKPELLDEEMGIPAADAETEDTNTSVRVVLSCPATISIEQLQYLTTEYAIRAEDTVVELYQKTAEKI